MKYLDKLIKVNAKTRAKKHYESLGYKEDNGFFFVTCDDLLEHSRELEVRKCDYCGKDFARKHESHVIINIRFGKDICGECVLTLPELRKEVQKKKDATWKDKYGCHPMQVEEIRDKVYNTWNEKYNGHPMHNKEVYENWKALLIDKYGGLSPMCDSTVREKAMITLYENNNIPTSSQQKEIYQILKDKYDNCVLNYPLSSLALDILLQIENVKIDIEYDGSYWHQDEQKDRKRDEFVKSQGYKILRIKAKHKIPTLEALQGNIEKLLNGDCNFILINLE